MTSVRAIGLAGAALVAALVVSGRPAAALETIVRPDPVQRVAAVSLWFRAPSAGFEAAHVPGLARLAAQTCAASAGISGTSLATFVRRSGGTLAVSAFPDSVAVTATVAPDRAGRLVAAMTAAYFAPVATEAGLEIARRTASEDALFASFDAQNVIEDALGAALFEAGPLHDGTIGDPRTLRAVELAPVRAFAQRAFRPANATLVVTGAVDPAVTAQAATREGAAPGAEAPIAQTPHPGLTAARSANVAGIGLGWAGPPIADDAAATAMDFLADALFAPRTGAVQRALKGRKATVTGKFVTYHAPGLFLVTIAGDDAAAVRPDVERAIAGAATPLAQPDFDAARAAFVYRILDDLDTPAQRAETFGWYAVEGNAAYAPAENAPAGRYFTLAAALTPHSVADVARRYLGAAPTVVVVRTTVPVKAAATEVR